MDRQPDGPDAEVWVVDLAQPAAVVAALRSTLDRRERAAAARRAEPGRRRHLVAHGAAREILGRWLRCPPAGVRFGPPGSHGRPALLRGGDLDWNLTHSGDLALVAVTRGAPIGVDVERVRPLVHLDALADRVLAPAERARGVAAGPDAPTSFLVAWTRKEAHRKAEGVGLSRPLRELDGAAPPRGWTWQDLSPVPGYVGAVATRRVGAQVRMRAWVPTATRPGGR